MILLEKSCKCIDLKNEACFVHIKYYNQLDYFILNLPSINSCIFFEGIFQ